LLSAVAAPAFGQAPPPPTSGRMPWEPPPPQPLHMVRLELDGELASATGAIDGFDDQNMLRIAIGFNLSRAVSMNFGTRVSSASKDPLERDFYYFDLITMGVRVSLDTGRRIIGYVAGDASLTGISVPCSELDEFVCDDPSDTSFQPRLGLHGKVGVLFAVSPGVFDVGVHLGTTKTIPDEGGWFTLGAGLVYHFGQLHPSQIATPGPAAPAPGGY
jgi:hypothetical protein